MGAAQSDPQVLHEAETGAGPVAAPATNIVRTTKQHGIVIRIWAEDLHKGATRLMDDLLDDKEAIKRKKGVEADIKKMWEIYRENLEFGCIISTDCIEDAEAPSAPVSSELERSGSLASRHPSPPMGRQRSSSPVGSPLTPTAKFAREWLVASSSAMSRLDTPLAASCPHTSPLGQEGDEGGEGCVAPRHGDLPGDLAPSGEERGRPLSRQRSSSPVETSQRFSSPIRPKPS
ncbi:hypothetical protein T484DRAFT_1806757 [Baffinella frigidus]|nr:hypothetical protein T484DRAFT_1806757 [Cryptophyta sp. CCMP2293]